MSQLFHLTLMLSIWKNNHDSIKTSLSSNHVGDTFTKLPIIQHIPSIHNIQPNGFKIQATAMETAIMMRKIPTDDPSSLSRNRWLSSTRLIIAQYYDETYDRMVLVDSTSSFEFLFCAHRVTRSNPSIKFWGQALFVDVVISLLVMRKTGLCCPRDRERD